VTVAGHVRGESGVIPDRSSARALASLKVDPGAYLPIVAVDSPLPPGPLAATSTSPVEGRIATIALAGTTPARIPSAAS